MCFNILNLYIIFVTSTHKSKLSRTWLLFKIEILVISEQKIDVRNVDLKKMRVKQLRKILQSWEEECNGCIEKSDFIQRIEELKDKHIEL